MSKILVYGHKGWIGEQVIQLLKTRFTRMVGEVKLGFSRVDDIESLQYELELEKPTHVMAFIGRTHGKIGSKEYKTIDYLEQPGKLRENVRDNLFSPLSLAILCQQLNIHFTYMGTGCIFDYDEDHPYPPASDDPDVFESDMTIGFTEEDLPNFFASSYSTVKGYTDRLMHLLENSVLNVRIRMPITSTVNGRNFITKIVNYEKICSIPNSMTVLPTLLPVMIDMALRKETGTINLVNPGLISHNEILTLYKEIVDPSFTWQNFDLEEQSRILAAGRSNNFLDTTKLTDKYPKVPNIRDAVIMCLKEMSKLSQQDQPKKIETKPLVTSFVMPKISPKKEVNVLETEDNKNL